MTTCLHRAIDALRTRFFSLSLAPAVALALFACLTPLGSGGVAMAQDGPGETRILFSWEHVAPIDTLTDPRDAGLRRVAGLIPDRLRALRLEFEDMERNLPEPMFELALELFASPMRMIMVHRDVEGQMEGMGVGAGFSFGMADRRRAERIHTQLREALTMAAGGAEPPMERSETFPTMLRIDAPFGAIRFGPREVAEGGWRYEILLGALGDPDEAFALLPTPPDTEKTFVRGELDFRNLAPIMNMLGFLAAMADPQAAQGFMALEEFGFVGPDAIAIELHAGERNGWRTLHAAIRGAASRRDALGVSTEALRDSHLQVVPADATAVIFGMRLLHQWWSLLERLVAQSPRDKAEFDQFWADLDIDPGADIFGAIGPAMGVYCSESTGGGGMLSFVGVASLRDRARLLSAMDKLIDVLHERIARNEDVDGRVHFRRWRDGNVEFAQLQFPGLPIPFEPTFAVTDAWLLVGATPQAAHAAVRQASGRGDSGLPSNESFRRGRAAIGVDGEIHSIIMFDTPRVLNSGYGWLSLIGSLLSNAVRPRGGGEGAGLVVPVYSELREGIRPIVAVTTWEGDDLITRAVADSSNMANLAGVLGGYRPTANIAMLPMAAGLLLPALGEARSSALEIADRAQLQQIHAGAVVYAMNHRDRYPPDYETLIKNDHIVPGILESPYGPVPDGRGNYYFNFNGRMTYDPTFITGYSRAAYFHGRSVSVLFDDGHVVSMPIGEFHELLKQPQHADIDWMLP